MASARKAALILTLVMTLAACGGSGSSDEPAPADTTTTTARIGESIGVGNAIDRTRAVVEEAEDRLNTIDQLAPSE